MTDDSVNAIITDPPYYSTNLEFDKKPQVNWIDLFQELHRVCKYDGAIVVFSQQPFTTDLINANRENFRYEIIWEKSLAMGFLNANKRPLRAHENILIFSSKGHGKYNPQKTKLYPPPKNPRVRRNNHKAPHYGRQRTGASVHVDDGTRYPRSVLKYKNVLRSWGNKHAIHPTQKPLDLVKWLVLTYTDLGDTVFDPFAGSGTTACAAIETGRKYIACERDEKYFYHAKKRIEEVTASFGQPKKDKVVRRL